MTNLPVRNIVRGIVYDDSGQEPHFLLLFAKKGYWQNPQGGIDHNESPEMALRREIKEETGLKTLDVLLSSTVNMEYDTERKGQIIHASLFACVVKANMNEPITLGETENHSQYKWVKFHEALMLLNKYPEQIEVFKRVCTKAKLVNLEQFGKQALVTPELFLSTIEKECQTFDIDLIKLAYEFASKAHAGQKRASGEDYITHPLAVAKRLAEERLDQTTVIAGLLHDVPEDTNVTIEEVEKEFGSDVAKIVRGVTKLGTIKYRGMERYAENLRKMFVAMAEDLRVVFVKFADRLHNLKTLGSLPPVKQKRIATETLEIYAPIANRLGMGRWKGELEDLAFPYVYPDEFKKISEAAGTLIEHRTTYLETLKPIINQYLNEENVPMIKIESRVKHLYSLWRKITRKSHEGGLDSVYDLVAFRIIVPTIQDCYHALGSLHARYKPLSGRIKDYIAQPKPNGYQSLHTTVFTDNGVIVEIQIRTEDMHQQAEHGVAAHFHYDETIKAKNKQYSKISGDKQTWLQRLAEWQKEFADDQEFLDSLKLDIFKNRIFVFTPAGDVIDLPEDATPIDFAYHIHTELGNQCSGARINNEFKALDTSLKSGDVVEIVADKNRKGPTEDWLKIVKTHMAREHIKQYVHKQRKGILAKLFSKKDD